MADMLQGAIQPAAAPAGGALTNYMNAVVSQDPDAINTPVADSVLAQQSAGGGGGNQYVDQQAQFAQDLRGQGSATDQYAQLKAQRDQAAQQKTTAIRLRLLAFEIHSHGIDTEQLLGGVGRPLPHRHHQCQ